jgi:hypothetical protein
MLWEEVSRDRAWVSRGDPGEEEPWLLLTTTSLRREAMEIDGREGGVGNQPNTLQRQLFDSWKYEDSRCRMLPPQIPEQLN